MTEEKQTKKRSDQKKKVSNEDLAVMIAQKEANDQRRFYVLQNGVSELMKRIDVIGQMIYDAMQEEGEEGYTEEEIEDFEERGKIPRREKKVKRSNVEAKIDGE